MRKRQIIGYCEYCKNPIFEDEDYIDVESAEEYIRHVECDFQKKNYGTGFYEEDE